MFCKHCGAELEHEQEVCHNCGEPVEGEKTSEKKKGNGLKLTLSIISCVLLAAMLAAIVFVGAGGQWSDIVKLFKGKENNIFYKDSYTIEDEDADKNASVVVATMGEHKLTNAQLQIFYWCQVYDFIEYAQGYPEQYGLDVSKPMNEQICNTSTGMTWQQYFLQGALEEWQGYVLLSEKAAAAGFTLSESDIAIINNYEADMADTVTDAGYASLDEMLQAELGKGVTVADYKQYLTLYHIGNQYFEKLVTEAVTDAEIEAWFEEQKEDLAKYGLTKEIGNLTDIRHLLVAIAEEDDEENKTYTEAEWEACRQEAQALLDQWLAGEKTEESFAALVAEKTDDTYSAASGGLYTYVYKSGEYNEDGEYTGQYVVEFEDWCANPERKKGDCGLVKTDYGYHIMYCVESDTAWIRYSRDSLESQEADLLRESLKSEASCEVDYKLIAITKVTFQTA